MATKAERRRERRIAWRLRQADRALRDLLQVLPREEWTRAGDLEARVRLALALLRTQSGPAAGIPDGRPENSNPARVPTAPPKQHAQSTPVQR